MIYIPFLEAVPLVAFGQQRVRLTGIARFEVPSKGSIVPQRYGTSFRIVKPLFERGAQCPPQASQRRRQLGANGPTHSATSRPSSRPDRKSTRLNSSHL